MNIYIAKRSFIRIISFILAIIISLGLYAVSTNMYHNKTSQQLEYNYLKSISSLSEYMQNIDNALIKVTYSNSPTTINDLSSQLWKEASYAKESISALPLSALHLENTYKFLSQVGDYCMSISKKISSGQEITSSERENLAKLSSYADNFLNEVVVLQDAINTGSISFASVMSDVKEEKDDLNKVSAVNIADGFTEFEEGFSEYPSLIYDGPFSDHIMQREPIMLKDAKEITKEKAKEISSKALDIDIKKVKDDTDEAGKMPSYTFKTDSGNSVAVTKNGGLLSYVLKHREIKERKLSAEDCIESAKKYLQDMGIKSMQDTYYEISNNLITINFAYKQGDVLCYTDLVKVSVAMDNGEILSYDGRGYITNHKERSDIKATISEENAKKKVSQVLNVKSSKLCVIPGSDLEEILCYEFKCSSENDDNVLVYVNAKTGEEEQVLILYIDENGTLTK